MYSGALITILEGGTWIGPSGQWYDFSEAKIFIEAKTLFRAPIDKYTRFLSSPNVMDVPSIGFSINMRELTPEKKSAAMKVFYALLPRVSDLDPYENLEDFMEGRFPVIKRSTAVIPKEFDPDLKLNMASIAFSRCQRLLHDLQLSANP